MSLPRLIECDESPLSEKCIATLNPLSCTVTEERNGEYELEMEVSNADRYFNEINVGRVILAPHDSKTDWQPFEIYSIENTLTGIARIHAWHYSYRYNKWILEPHKFSGTVTPSNIGTEIMSLTPWDCDAAQMPDLWGDGTFEKKAFEIKEPISFREMVMSGEDSVLGKWGGELEWGCEMNGITHKNQIMSGRLCKLHAARGVDSGVVLKYGTNIISMRREQTIEDDVFNAVYPWWKGEISGGSGETTVTLPEGILYRSSLSKNFGTVRLVHPLDLSKEFETQPSVVELRNKAQNWLYANAPTVIPENIDISVLQMDEEEKSSIAKLNLCDTLRIAYPEMGVNVSAKVTKVVFNVLLDRYDSISVGTTGKNMNRAIKKVVGIR